MNEDLWEHLAELGISKCEEGDVEIDMHEDDMIVKSFHFDCLKLSDGTTYYDVDIAIAKLGDSHLFYSSVDFLSSDISGLKTNKVISKFHKKLYDALRLFIKNKKDLI